MPEKPLSLQAAMLRGLLDRAGMPGDDMLARAIAGMERQVHVGGKRVTRQKLPRLGKSAASTVHTVKVSLYGARPPIWRRLEIPSALPLPLVHEVLQVAFRWHGYHLHEFQTVCGEFGDPADDDDLSERADEAAVALGQVAASESGDASEPFDPADVTAALAGLADETS